MTHRLHADPFWEQPERATLEKHLVDRCREIAVAMAAYLEVIGQRNAKHSGTTSGAHDGLLYCNGRVIPIEFKVGAKKFQQADYEQAWDYGLDLKNFHAPSHAVAIFPILCATEAPAGDRRWKPPHADGVRPPFCCNAAGLGPAIALALDGVGSAPAPITPSAWGTGS